MNEDKNPSVNEMEWVYCIVGNIIEKHEFGENKEIKYGTKQFRPGAKVYCLPHLGYGGTAYDQIVVMGKPRKQFRLIKIVMPRKYIANFRLQKVWDKRIIDAMGIFDQNSNELNKESLQKLLDYFNQEAGFHKNN